MAGSFSERLQLIVDATTGQAEARFAKLGQAAGDTAKTARASGEAVAAAADRAAQARLKEQESAGLVRVAEQRLLELRESGRAKSSQIAAAEERLAVAQRNLSVAAQQSASAQQRHLDVQSRAAGEAERFSRSTGVARQAMVGLATAGAALVGVGLVEYLRGSVNAFTEGARTAGQLAVSMNATVEQAGQLGTLAQSIGLDFNDLLEIQAEFAQSVQKSGDLLDDMGAAVQRNEDGTINWATTLEDALTQLQKIPDATERNRKGFQLFGEEGYKQLSRLLVSGMSVQDALEQIGTPFTDEDVAAVQEYNRSMMELSLTGADIERTLGRALLPVIDSVASGLSTFLDVITAIPAPIGIATAAALTLGITGFNPAAVAGERLAVVTGWLTTQLGLYRYAAATAGEATALLGAAQGLAAGTARGMLAAFGGPLGLALIAAAVGYELVSSGIDKFKESSRQAAVEQEQAQQRLGHLADTSEDLGRELADQAGFWDGVAASTRGANEATKEAGGFLEFVNTATGGVFDSLLGLADQFGDGELAAQGFTSEIERQKEELGAYGVDAQVARDAVQELNDLIASGSFTQEEFADKVAAAAQAQTEQSRTTDLAKAAIDALNAVTRDAVQTQLDLIDAQLAQSDGTIAVQKAAHELGQTVDDLSTPWNEVTEVTNRFLQTALSASGAAADAAVAAARAAGTALTPLTEAQTRADAVIASLRESLNNPGLTEGAKQQLQDVIGQLETAKSKGDIEAILRLTGVQEATGEIDQATQDRDATINVEQRGGQDVAAYLSRLAKGPYLALVRVESRGGPAVEEYFQRLVSKTRLALVRVESRGGPAVEEYFQRLVSKTRLALIRVESRGGPAVDEYLERVRSRSRLALIHVESRGGPAVDAYLDNVASNFGRGRTAVINVQRNEIGGPAGTAGPTGLRGAPRGAGFGLLTGAGGSTATYGDVNNYYNLTVPAPSGAASRSAAEYGREIVRGIRAYEKLNGTGWRSDR